VSTVVLSHVSIVGCPVVIRKGRWSRPGRSRTLVVVATVASPVVDYASAPARGPLAGLVDRQVGYRMEGFEPGVHMGLPSLSLTVVLSFDDPLSLTALPDPTDRPASLWTSVGGLNDAPVAISHEGRQHGVQLDLSPLATRALLGVPAGALANQVVSLDDLLGDTATEMWERTWVAATWSERFEQLERVLVGRLLRSRDDGAARVRPELRWAWNQLAGSNGSVAVADLADELGWSRRHLSAQFRQEFGLSPRTIARLARFDAATVLLRGPQRLTLAQVAARAGYADQSHLTREWRRLGGASPTAWQDEEQFPSVQDPDGQGRRD
jgi:AraC-like DNA-binding protein